MTTPTEPLILCTDSAIAEERRKLLLFPGVMPTALCLSGGGVRSAAFCLGVIQALADRELLGRFHYLSTVSGGGYIGAWLTRVIGSRLDAPGSPPEVKIDDVGALISRRVAGQEDEAVRDLRHFTNFLTPNPGLMSLDTWAGAMLWLRNTLINWLLFLPVFAAVVAVPIAYFAFASSLLAQGSHPLADVLLAALATACLAFACFQTIIALPSHNDPDPRSSSTMSRAFGRTGWELFCRVVAPMVIWCVLVPVSVTSSIQDTGGAKTASTVFVQEERCEAVLKPLSPALAGCSAINSLCPIAASVSCGAERTSDTASPYEQRFVALPFVSLLACLLAYGLAYLHVRAKYAGTLSLKDHLRPFWRSTWAWIVSSAVSAALLWYGIWLAHGLNVFWLALAGPVWVGLAEMLRTLLYVAFRREGLRADLDREWLARLNAAKLIIVLTGAAVGAIVILGGLLSAGLSDRLLSWLTAGGLTSGSIAALVGKSAQTAFAPRSAADAKAQTKRRISPNLILSLSILLFGSTLLILVGRAVALIAGWIAAMVAPFWSQGSGTPFLTITVVTILLGAVAGWLAWALGGRINVNRFSLHAVYRNRLVRGFLGSARPAKSRDPECFTEFDPDDNVRMADTFCRRNPPALLPVINVALNRTSGKDTARAERKAESFTITPFRCGAATLCGPQDDRADKSTWSGAYARTEAYAGNERQTGVDDEAKGISLGTAIAISGAAASPNMGYHSSPLVAFVMTLFNVRLGAWLPNPGAGLKPETLRKAGPRNSLPALLSDLAGRSDRDSDYIYLSDGGHFDNLGLYEMLRRRCRLIVIADASQDEHYAYEDLGRVKQHALIDMGIAIDFKPVIAVGGTALDKLGAFGNITYPDGARGQLLYLKPWISEDLPLELAAFGKRKASFPHESTGNQFFTESDFESYRRLGEFIADRAVAAGSDAAPDPKDPQPSPSNPLDRVFAGLARKRSLTPDNEPT